MKKSKNNVVENQLRNYVGVKGIKEDYVLLDDNSLIAILEILPIDFDNLSGKKQDKILEDYAKWINNLSYPVQIIVRNTNVDLDKQVDLILENAEREIKRREDMREMLKLFDEFREWLLKYVAKEKKVHRLYYLIIPLVDFANVTAITKQNESGLECKRALLNMRVKENINLLEKTGVGVHRLGASQLENLFSSYFYVNNQKGHCENNLYLSPNRLFSLWRQNKRG
jgi:hypothetical protein